MFKLGDDSVSLHSADCCRDPEAVFTWSSLSVDGFEGTYCKAVSGVREFPYLLAAALWVSGWSMRVPAASLYLEVMRQDG